MTFLQLLDRVTAFAHEVLSVNSIRATKNQPPLDLPKGAFVLTWWDATGQCFLVDVTEQVKMLVADAEEQLPELKAARERNLVPPGATPERGLELADVLASFEGLLRRKPE